MSDLNNNKNNELKNNDVIHNENLKIVHKLKNKDKSRI